MPESEGDLVRAASTPEYVDHQVPRCSCSPKYVNMVTLLVAVSDHPSFLGRLAAPPGRSATSGRAPTTAGGSCSWFVSRSAAAVLLHLAGAHAPTRPLRPLLKLGWKVLIPSP
ncbi:hypothetical protein [Streptomyces echinatus]|uniref:hypothetical protein n=1 Tax=Streptomyces echinatus TaxID=67293 RepID=UPI003CD06DEF